MYICIYAYIFCYFHAILPWFCLLFGQLSGGCWFAGGLAEGRAVSFGKYI